MTELYSGVEKTNDRYW